MDELSSKYLTQMIEKDHIYSVLELAEHLPYTVMDVISEAGKLGYSFDNLTQDPNKVMIVKDEHVTKQPHVRIEFDHINDVPDIFIDGKKVTEGLVNLNIDWKTNTESISEKSFEIKLVNKDGYETTIGENLLF
ncbi:hypothetical protein [Leuconostoc pseudomesenteroides]|uniref:hypothetical protein n=1 Tax=Leuconostoc pseudomesenteroides TaxID=33968 RepID=UPI00301C764C